MSNGDSQSINLVKQPYYHTILFIILTLGSIVLCTRQSASDPEELCPKADELKGWEPDGKPRKAKGDELFLLINGGADIYHEYGFRQTVYQAYKDETGSRLNLEVYEMECPESAFGIFTFKTSKEGKSIEVGHEGWMEEYFLNFWKGNYLITIIGLDSEQKTVDGLMEIAEAIDGKIEVSGQKPDIINYLPEEDLTENGITYLKGQLGLFNQYVFDTKNIFGVKEGILGEYRNYSVYVFEYVNRAEAEQWYQTAKMNLQKSSYFMNFDDQTGMFSMKDNNGNLIIVKPFHHTVMIFVGSTDSEATDIFNRIENKTDNK